MKTANRIGFTVAIASIAVVLGLVWTMLGSPADVTAQNGPTPGAYITAVIGAGDDTVSWSNPGGCSSDYNIYKAVRPPRNNAERSRTLLGTAVSGSTSATLAISHSGGNPFIPDSVKVELYCGAFDAESSENDLVESTELPVGGFSGIREGTYSSEPLTALTISSGTLSPGFERGIGRYSAEVESDVEVITLDPAVLTGYQTDFVRNPTFGVTRICGAGTDCTYSYGDGTTTGIVLSDADTETAGFQVNLTPGENQLGIVVNKGRVNASARLYYITVRSQNSLATGAPTIGGIAQVGQTLKADTSGISDTDGLTNVAYSYQWLADDNVIGGATNTTHTLQAAEAGKVIKVKVTFADEAGYLEYLTSEATAEVAPNFPATGAPTITGTAEMGETLTADTSGIVDIDGLDNVSFSYQWIRSDGTADLNNTAAPFQWNPTDGTADLDIDGATSATYTITATDVDKAIKLRVDFTDDKGSIESLTSSATVVVPVEAAFTFSIDGTTVTCDSYNVHIVNLPKKECDDPSSIDQGASEEIEVEIEIARSVNSQLYKFGFHIYQMEDSTGHYMTVEANDLCLGPGLAESASIEVTPNDGTGPFTYTDDGTIFELCPAGTFQLYVPWYRYNYTDQEYEYAGTFRRYFFITSDDEVDASIEKVRGITALYPDPPASHGEVQIEGTKQSEVLNRELTTFSLSIGGLVPDSDAETTDYVVRLKVIGENGPYKEVPWCHVGNVGYSYLLKTVPEDGRWAMDAHVLGNCLRGSWPDTLQVELFDGSDLTNYSEPIVFHGSHIISYTGELLYPKYGTHEFIAGKDIALGALPNSAATGAPTISGTAQVGETLTADTSGIADEDGLDNATFSYQWLSSRDTAIPGATGSTYTLVSTDLGKIIKVKVTFTDDEGNEESLTSAATAAVADRSNNPATGAPTISGTMQVGQTLTASTSGIADDDGLTNVSYTYQWIANDGTSDSDIQDATLSTYTLVSDDVGKTIKVKVSFSDDAENEETLTSAATDSVVAAPASNTAATGVPTITGTAQLGQTLTADTSEISDADGLTNVNYSFQWLSSRDTEIDGATSSTYSLQESDEGKVIKVRVTFTDDVGHEESLTSEATVAVAAAPTPLTANSHDVPTDHDGLSVFTFELRFSEEFSLSYKTLRDHAFTVTNGTVTRVRRLERPGNIRWEISVRPDGNRDVTVLLPITTDCATQGAICIADGRMLSRQVELTVSGPAAARPNNTATGAPTISGTAQVGQTLTASTSGISDSDGLTNATFSYQWLSSRDTEIAGATGAAHALVETDEGKAIKVRVSFTDDRGNQETLTSAATGAVAARPNSTARGAPTISGTAQVGQTLTASTSGISDSDGLTNATFSYQWLSSRDTEIAGATGAAHALVETDEGKAIKVRVSFTDDRGNQETLTSAATGAVAARPNSTARGAPTISGTAQVGQTLTASTSGISDSDGLTNAAFSYQWLSDDAEINGATASSYTLVTADAGKAIKVMVSFTDDAGNDEELTSSAVTGAVATVVKPPLTATIHDVPSSHNGQDAFIFELRFSEPPKPDFSYRTVWDHAFTVTGGSVTYVRRLEPGKNVRWDITVTPDSSADVAIALNATTDCEADGAICTSDGERLPASISAIVSGPAPVGTVPVAAIASGTTPVAEGATVSFTISLDRAAPTALSVAVSVADAGGVLSGAAPRSVAFATSDNSKTITLPTRDDNAIKTASTVTVSLATGSGYTLGTATSASVSVTDNDTAVWTVSAQPTEIAEGGSSTITLAVANGKTFAANQTVSLAVTGTASGSDYSLSATDLTLPAGASSVTATVTARDDTSVESDETVIVTAIHDGQPIGSATVTIEANDVAVWTVSAQPTEIAEGGSSTITLAVANGKTFTANQTVSLAVTGTASGSDYSLSATDLTLPAGASSVTATVTARDDASVESDETVIVTAIHDGQPIGSATVTIEANDVAVWTVSAQPTEIAEGGSSTITLAVANGKTFTANQTVSLAVTGTTSGSDYSLSATELTLPAGASSVTATVTARDDASVESDETVIVTAIHDGQPIGSATVTIEANDVPLSNDATLSTLSLSGIDIGTFSSGTTDYSVIVEYDVASTTVTADPNDDGASVAVADANGVTYGTSRQVSLSSGDNEITVTVTAEDGNAMKVYTVTVTRAEPDVAWGERLPDRDIVLDSDAIPTGLWADDTNAWVISDCNVGEVNVYALSDGSKQDELSFTLADWSGCATALWSNGATLWVADFFSGGVRAYRLSDGARQSDQDLDRDAMLAAGNTIPSGLWSNGEIMWVADHSAGKVFAYRLLDWARVSTREFDLTDDSGVPIRPFGLWSNGETLLASNWNGDRVLAYDLSDGQRQTSLDIDTSASGTRNSGIWSDGETLWIVDDLDKRIYAYAVQGLGSTR